MKLKELVKSSWRFAVFFAAVGLAFTSLIISDDHDIAGGVLMMCAQFLDAYRHYLWHRLQVELSQERRKIK
jgi:hypothetical protein